jgi:hypothetical protein
MTYKDKFVAEVKHNGRILRVRDGYVYLPFGSEYSILFKNLDSRKALVNVHIDGDDVLDGHSLVIGPNETIELEGFMKGNVARNRFKFIEKTEQISQHRGDKIDDGLIRIEFAFEKPPIKIQEVINHYHHHHHHHRRDYWYEPLRWTYTNSVSDNTPTPRSVNTFNATLGSADAPENISANVSMSNIQTPISDLGITVKGSEVNQQFQYSSIGAVEDSQVIVIQLRGSSDSGNKVTQPITVKTKLTCKTCGTSSPSTHKFCPTCGTFLE